MAAPTDGPDDSTPAAIHHIVLGTDLGEASAAAEATAIDMAARLHSQLLVVNVIDPGGLRLPGGRFGPRLDQVRAEREASVSRIVARARDAGVTARFLVWHGEPGPGLLETAAAEGADLIVVGSHRRNRLGRLLLGSVSTHVIEHADRPVIVARGDEVLRYESRPADAGAG
ncbi:MAG TPA: universal stress protein [Candidatus Limnocylindrales bacterium]|nr:universal stress protein [Candidatus Limnocylindrales bacterium]